MSSNGRARRDAAVGVAVGRVVDEAAGLADPVLRRRSSSLIGPKGTFGAWRFDVPRRPARSSTHRQETVPRQAASVIVLRGGAEALEVLLVKRNPHARFMGGVWVFPGGAVDAARGRGRRGPPRRGRARAGGGGRHRRRRPRRAREVLALDHARRGRRSASTRTSSCAAARRRRSRGRRRRVRRPRAGSPPRPRSPRTSAARSLLVFPTIKHLEQLGAFPTADALLAYARGREVGRSQPRVIGEGETARIVLPGEPGYDDDAHG